MDKREFLKTSGAFVAANLLPGVATAEPASTTSPAPRSNWAGNYTFRAPRFETPKNVEEVQKIVTAATKVKGLGSRHSFNNIADSPQTQVALKAIDSMQIDKVAQTVTVGAGVTYGQLSPWLDQHGFALHNLASLPHISIIGACATGTHGSGVHNGNLSTAVTALELVTADGKLVTISRQQDGDQFLGKIIALGALGVATKVTLSVQPTFQMKQVVYENLSIAQLEHNLETIFSSGYSVSLFTDWQNHRITQVWLKDVWLKDVWLKSRIQPSEPATLPPLFYGATLQKQKLHPLAGHPAESCTEQMGIPGPWYERMPHFRMNFTPSSGQEIQSEYFIPRNRGYEAILAIESLRDKITPHLFISELRTIAADNLWLSPAYQRDSMAIHFTWKPEAEAVRNVLPLIEAKLAPFAARPHWAKVFTMAPATCNPFTPNSPTSKPSPASTIPTENSATPTSTPTSSPPDFP